MTGWCLINNLMNYNSSTLSSTTLPGPVTYRAAVAIATARAVAASSAFLARRSLASCVSSVLFSLRSWSNLRSAEDKACLSCCRDCTKLWSLQRERGLHLILLVLQIVKGDKHKNNDMLHYYIGVK
jgi:hypothetical protein